MDNSLLCAIISTGPPWSLKRVLNWIWSVRDAVLFSWPYAEMDLSCDRERGAVQPVLSITMKGFQNFHWTFYLCPGFVLSSLPLLLIRSTLCSPAWNYPIALDSHVCRLFNLYRWWHIWKIWSRCLHNSRNSLVRNAVLGKHPGESRLSTCSWFEWPNPHRWGKTIYIYIYEMAALHLLIVMYWICMEVKTAVKQWKKYI